MGDGAHTNTQNERPPLLTQNNKSSGSYRHAVSTTRSVKMVMVYQCHFTKCIILTPLSSNRAAGVALQLLDSFGAAVILMTDNRSEFIAFVSTYLNELWPQLIIIHGKPRHPQTHGSVERAHRTGHKDPPSPPAINESSSPDQRLRDITNQLKRALCT